MSSFRAHGAKVPLPVLIGAGIPAAAAVFAVMGLAVTVFAAERTAGRFTAGDTAAVKESLWSDAREELLDAPKILAGIVALLLIRSPAMLADAP